MSDQVQEELKWLQLALMQSRMAMRRACRQLEKAGGSYSSSYRVRKAYRVLQKRLSEPVSIHEWKAHRAGITPDQPP